MSLFIRENQVDSNKLLFLLHGNSMSSSYYNPLFKEINDWKIVAPDLFGHGESPRVLREQYALKNYIETLKNLLENYNYEKLVIIGHSFGGNLACQLIREISKVKGLLLLSSVPINYANTGMPYVKVPDFVVTGNKEADVKYLKEKLKDFDVSEAIFSEVSEAILKTDPLFRERLFEDFAAGNFKDEVSFLKEKSGIRKALVDASNDTVINREYLADILNDADVFDKIYTIKNAGHFPLLDDSENCIIVINDFLQLCNEG